MLDRVTIRRGVAIAALAASICITLLALERLAVSPSAPRTLSQAPLPLSDTALDMIRKSADMLEQRHHVWNVVSEIVRRVNRGSPTAFETWHGEGELFGMPSTIQNVRGIHGFARANDPGTPSNDGLSSGLAPLLTYTLYNEAAYEHIRNLNLNHKAELDRERQSGDQDILVSNGRSIPSFPNAAIVLKTVWWPASSDNITALPVWDPDANPQSPYGNPYIGWKRVVAVIPPRAASVDGVKTVDFLGRSFAGAHQVHIEAFHHTMIDASLAARIMRDPEASKLAWIALGRPLRAGDYLLLVGMNMATREIGDWIWASLWWHDQPEDGPFAAGRPDDLKTEWRNYLMQAAFDSETPAAADGSPHICFNPWLEGRFADYGHGNGTVSNCMACHQRASYPPVAFLPITRGAPDTNHDPAFAAGRLRTGFLWSIALHSLP